MYDWISRKWEEEEEICLCSKAACLKM